MRSHPTPLHPVITADPFTKWGVDFIDCNPNLAGGHQHIIVAVDYFNKSLKTILQKTVSQSNSDWHIMLYLALWAYRTSVKTATNFSPFLLVHGVESILPVECEIPSLKLKVELLPDTSDLDRRLVHLEILDEQCRDAFTTIEENKKRVKVQ
jgi:hypothetical protein